MLAKPVNDDAIESELTEHVLYSVYRSHALLSFLLLFALPGVRFGLALLQYQLCRKL